MKKTLHSTTVATAAAFCLLLASCGKDDENKEPAQPAEVKIENAADLSKHLSSPGLQRKQGNIPEPENSSYGHEFELLTSQIILTPANTFDFEIKNPGQAYVMFVQFEGVNEYLQITVDANGNVVERSANNTQKHCMSCSPNGCTTINAQPAVLSNFEAPATVQIFQPPLQAGVPDLSFLSDPQYWSPPKSVTFKCFGSGTGDIFTTLTWNKTGDIDLWLIEPDGNKIYYANDVSDSGGELDYDNTSGYGPENIFYKEQAPAGKYEVWVDYYSGSGDPVDCVVSTKVGNQSYTDKVTLSEVKESKLVRTFTR